MTRATAERCWATVPAALLVAVAGMQIGLARTMSLSPWKGGGFGMFSTLDGRPFRYVRLFVRAPERSEELTVPASLEDAAASVEILPSDGHLERLARGILARERRRGRPVDSVRVEVWRAEFAAGSLAPGSRLVREYVLRAAP